MLARRLGQDRIAAEPEAADEIISSCARLPLALSIAIGRAASRPKRPLDRAGRRTARRQGQAGRARGRRRGHQRAGRVVLVLRPALRARGADVPPARRAPRARHLAVGGGQPGRDDPGRGWCRAARADQDPHGRRVPARQVHVPRPAPRLRGRPGRAARPGTGAPGRHAPGARPLPAHGDGGVAAVQPVPVPAAAGQPAAGRAARRRGGQGAGDGLVRRRGAGAARADRLRQCQRLRRPRLAASLDARPVLQPTRPVAGLRRDPADRAGRGPAAGRHARPGARALPARPRAGPGR